ncbi:MAG: hypothetical protein RL609_780 [Bacteroidota bacterium]|jgi:CRP-like cAMP-binding protein
MNAEGLIHFLCGDLKLSHEAQLALLDLIKEESYGKSLDIQKTGSTCKNIFFMSAGVARIYYWKEGVDITEHFAFEGQLIIRAESLFTSQKTNKGIQSITASQVLVIPAEGLFQLYGRFPEIESMFRRVFEKEWVNTIKRLESFQMKTAKERYLDLMKETEILSIIPLKMVASYLGITPESLSRIRSEL